MLHEAGLTVGLHCKACDRPLGTSDLDPELCGECMFSVMELIKDIDAPAMCEYDGMTGAELQVALQEEAQEK